MSERGRVEKIERRKPDQKVVDMLEKLTEHARSGELIGAMCVLSWHGDSVSHCWAISSRSQQVRMVGQMMCCAVDRANEINKE